MGPSNDPHWLFNQMGDAGCLFTKGFLIVAAICGLGLGVIGLAIASPLAFLIVVPLAALVVGVWAVSKLRGPMFVGGEPDPAVRLRKAMSIPIGPYPVEGRTHWTIDRMLGEMRRLSRTEWQTLAYHWLQVRVRSRPNETWGSYLDPFKETVFQVRHSSGADVRDAVLDIANQGSDTAAAKCGLGGDAPQAAFEAAASSALATCRAPSSLSRHGIRHWVTAGHRGCDRRRVARSTPS